MYVNVTKAISNNAESSLEDIDRRMLHLVDQLHRLALERAELATHQLLSAAFHPKPAGPTIQLHPND